VERQYPRLQQEPRDDPPHFDGPERQGLGRRLFIGFLIAIGAALACWWGGPKLGLDVPWYVPVIAFGIIVVATILPIITQPAPPGPDVDPGPDPNDQSP
jgi:uncharacterized membrane protein YbhN (UPF0104 family)